MIEIANIPPEEFQLTPEEMLEDAKKVVDDLVAQIPVECTPAQARILIRNSAETYALTSQLLFTVLDEKTPVLH